MKTPVHCIFKPFIADFLKTLSKKTHVILQKKSKNFPGYTPELHRRRVQKARPQLSFESTVSLKLCCSFCTLTKVRTKLKG